MDELVQNFYKRHPLAIHTTPSPLTICSITASTTPLSDHITEAPVLLPLEEQLTYSEEDPTIPTNDTSSHTLPIMHSPTPLSLPDLPLIPINTSPPSCTHTEPSEAEVDIGMHGCNFSTPPGFTPFDQTIPNHYHYGQKIQMPDNTHCWLHYIKFPSIPPVIPTMCSLHVMTSTA